MRIGFPLAAATTVLTAALWSTAPSVVPLQAAADPAPAVRALLSSFDQQTPGCAVGVAVDGQPVLAQGAGMADLEHDVPITPETIFEAGSVSKQFTAAAVLLLARDGKLSLDAPVRTYLPEVPDYGTPITVRQLLTHTSGLRDWGNLQAIAGWPRTSRAYTHAHVLDIVGHQKVLNFTPGTHWSYSNTGYNLAAILVGRLSGMSFADFTRTRIFEPLGMTRTSWRDDHTRIVKGRAVAYARRDGAFHSLMPFEDVYGNGGLLTTVGDLLKWNENFVRPTVGDAAFVREQQQMVGFSGVPGHGYGLGLMFDDRRGVRQVDHSGSTAGYVAHLARYPDQRVSVAVLCNRSDGGATQKAYDVADLYLADRAPLAPVPTSTYALNDADRARLQGTYRSQADGGSAITLVRDGGNLRIEGGARLFAQSATRLLAANGTAYEFDGTGTLRIRDRFNLTTYDKQPAAAPAAADLQAYAGSYVSDEVEVALRIVAEGSTLVALRRPDARLVLTPVYKDAFSSPALGHVVFRRDASGRVTALSIVEERMWDVRFTRQ